MTAIRAASSAQGHYTMLANAAMQDTRLSYQARGIIAYVLSLKPQETEHLTAAMIEAGGTNGRESVRSALKELERYGYYRKSKQAGPGGKWIWDQVISDAPVGEVAGDHTTGNPQMVPPGKTQVRPSAGNPAYGAPADKDFKDVNPKDVERRSADAGVLAPAADDGALFPGPPPPPPPVLTPEQSVTKRAQALTAAYHAQVPLCSFVAVRGIVKKAISAGEWTDDQIGDALTEMARQRRPVTANSLLFQLNQVTDGGEPREVAYEGW